MTDVIGILGFALHAANKVYNVIESIKDAPSDIQALRDDAFQVHGFLEKVLPSEVEGGRGLPLRLFDTKDIQINGLVKRAQLIMAAVDTFISKVTTQKDDGSCVVKKLKWAVKSGEAKKLSDQFRAFYASLSAIYTVSTSATVDAVLSGQQAQQAVLSEYGIMLHAIYTLVTLRDAAHEQRQGCSMRFSELCAAQARPQPFIRAQTHTKRRTTSELTPRIRTQLAGPMESDGYRDSSPRGFYGSDEESAIVSPSFFSTMPHGSLPARSCPDECVCTCHSSSSDISPIPSWLNPWIGRLNIPRTLAAVLAPSLFPCTSVHCQKNRGKVHTVRYYLPVWFVHVEASIRFEAFPLHFYIQTPRVVPSLDYLWDLSFDEFRAKLSKRELTLQDVESNGYSVLHRLLVRELELGDAFDMIRYVLGAGVPLDWQFENLTAVDYIVFNAQCHPEFRLTAQSLNLNVMKPLLHESLDEVSGTLSAKLKQSDLIEFLLQPHPDVAPALDVLRGMLTLPSTSVQIHLPDVNGWTAVDYAARTFPEGVEVLLQAGASTRCGTFQLHQHLPAKWQAVSALIRAGYPVNRRKKLNFGRSVLHSVAAHRQPSYRFALELVRHGGHLLNWDARLDCGDTSFEVDYFAADNSANESLQRIRELYRAQRVPHHAQYISSFDGERLMDTEEAATQPRISLIDTALCGNVKSIGRLILAGAMVNERDEEDRTLGMKASKWQTRFLSFSFTIFD